MKKTPPVISIVCPFFNEEEMVEFLVFELTRVMKILGESYEIVCVNDGSRDRTLDALLEAKKAHPEIRILNLSRNFGKEAALTAGLDAALGDVVIPIDADLQDPPDLIIDLVAEWMKGYDVVLAKRADRDSDHYMKKMTANFFYKLHNKISLIKIPENVGDFRLISRKVVTAIQMMPENQRFMKGIFAWVGFNTRTIEYSREPRKAGRSSFHGWSLWNFALEGFTSFSTILLRIWLYIGLFFSTLSFLYGGHIVLKTMIFGVDWPGYASIMTMILFLGGLQMVGIGILGEYIGRIYVESKRRPTYILEGEY